MTRLVTFFGSRFTAGSVLIELFRTAFAIMSVRFYRSIAFFPLHHVECLRIPVTAPLLQYRLALSIGIVSGFQELHQPLITRCAAAVFLTACFAAREQPPANRAAVHSSDTAPITALEAEIRALNHVRPQRFPMCMCFKYLTFLISGCLSQAHRSGKQSTGCACYVLIPPY